MRIPNFFRPHRWTPFTQQQESEPVVIPQRVQGTRQDPREPRQNNEVQLQQLQAELDELRQLQEHLAPDESISALQSLFAQQASLEQRIQNTRLALTIGDPAIGQSTNNTGNNTAQPLSEDQRTLQATEYHMLKQLSTSLRTLLNQHSYNQLPTLINTIQGALTKQKSDEDQATLIQRIAPRLDALAQWAKANAKLTPCDRDGLAFQELRDIAQKQKQCPLLCDEFDQAVAVTSTQCTPQCYELSIFLSDWIMRGVDPMTQKTISASSLSQEVFFLGKVDQCVDELQSGHIRT